MVRREDRRADGKIGRGTGRDWNGIGKATTGKEKAKETIRVAGAGKVVGVHGITVIADVGKTAQRERIAGWTGVIVMIQKTENGEAGASVGGRWSRRCRTAPEANI